MREYGARGSGVPGSGWMRSTSGVSGDVARMLSTTTEMLESRTCKWGWGMPSIPLNCYHFIFFKSFYKKVDKNHPRLILLFIFIFLCLLRMMEAAMDRERTRWSSCCVSLLSMRGSSWPAPSSSRRSKPWTKPRPPTFRDTYCGQLGEPAEQPLDLRVMLNILFKAAN